MFYWPQMSAGPRRGMTSADEPGPHVIKGNAGGRIAEVRVGDSTGDFPL